MTYPLYVVPIQSSDPQPMFSSDSSSSRRVEQHYTDYYSAETSRNTLLIIDPQKDFHPGGNLAIPTANKDAARIANLIANHAEEIDDIVVTLDTHQKMDIDSGVMVSGSVIFSKKKCVAKI